MYFMTSEYFLGPDDIYLKFRAEFRSSPLDKALSQLSQEDHKVEELIDRYLNDYINMVYPSNSDIEMKVRRQEQ